MIVFPIRILASSFADLFYLSEDKNAYLSIKFIKYIVYIKFFLNFGFLNEIVQANK